MDQDLHDYYYEDYNETACQVELGGAVQPVRAALYCIVMAVGVPGNVALLVALWDHRGGGLSSRPQRRSWTNSEILASNLAASDLLFLGSLPLWIYTEINKGEWRAGAVGCKVVPYITALNMYMVVWLVTFMSIDRYLAVVKPCFYRRVKKIPLVLWSCVFTWLTSALLALPVFLSRMLVRDEPLGELYCREAEEQISPLSSLCLLLFTFFFPLGVTLFCYGSLIRVLARHSLSSVPGPAPLGRSIRRSMRVVIWVIAAFILSWLPFNSFRLLRAVWLCLTSGGGAPCWLLWVAVQGMEWTAPLAFANSCVNPLVFGAVGRTLLCRGLAARYLGHTGRVSGVSGASSHTSPST